MGHVLQMISVLFMELGLLYTKHVQCCPICLGKSPQEC